MGSGSSRNPTIGAPANPRVVYSDKLSKKQKQEHLVDSPVLVDIEHGSIRYRYNTYDGEPVNKNKRTERPYEEIETKKSKQDYFYHARLNDFSLDGKTGQEDKFKSLHVIKAPTRANCKRVYYVYGQGMDATDGVRVKPTETKEQGEDYSWPGLRVPNHLYYRLQFGSAEVADESQEDRFLKDLKSTPDKSTISFILSPEELAHGLKAKMAVKILKAASDIHICYHNLELRDKDMVRAYLTDMKQNEEGQTQCDFSVELKLM